MDMRMADFKKVLKCYKKERKAICGWCKERECCQRFERLLCEYQTILLKDRRKNHAFCTVVRFSFRNLQYKLQPMTVECLHTKLYKKLSDALRDDVLQVFLLLF